MANPPVMRRFWLFGAEVYYPSGGWHDLLGTYATLSAASDAARVWHGTHELETHWHHIVDSDTGAIVAWTSEQGYGSEHVHGPEEPRAYG